MIALRPLSANSVLTGGVASGPVVGISAATTPDRFGNLHQAAFGILGDDSDRAHPDMSRSTPSTLLLILMTLSG